MGDFISLYLQILLYTVGPILAFGLAAWFARQLFVRLIGSHSGRRVLLTTLAPSTPLREAAHVATAVLFFQRIEAVRFLDLRAPDEELSYVERSYLPRNPLAQLGNFFYAIAPAVLGLVVVFAIFMLCFGGVMESFFSALSALPETGGLGDYLLAALELFPAIFFSADVSVFFRIFGAVLLLLLSMGIFVSLGELLDGLFGAVLYAVLALAVTGVLLLLDARVQRVALEGLRAFATGVIALYIPVLLALLLLLVFAAAFFVIRKLGSVPETGTAVELYREEK